MCFSQELKTKKIFNIKVSVGDYSQPGEYLNLQTSYAPYTKGEFDGITSGKVLPIGGDFFKSYSKNGTALSVQVRNREITAEVVGFPFYNKP